jgi:hypothetical protein
MPKVPAPRAAPKPKTSAAKLQSLIEEVPDPATGRVSFGTSDNLGDQMGALDTIPDPAGGYLGVYHTPFRSPHGRDFRISLAHSTDLIHWTRIRILDPNAASMPTLRPIPRTAGYLLAYEKKQTLPASGGDIIRVTDYRTLADLLAGRFAARRNLPRSFSRYNNGTPTILSINWRRGLASSVIQLGFHYQTDRQSAPGADREGLGEITGFHRWTARRDRLTDASLDQQGLRGNHGDWRQFSFEGDRWRLYEAQTSFDNFATWHVLLYNARSRRMHPLALRTGAGTLLTSVGNPIAKEETAPGGSGQVLVITTFVFAASAPEDIGELVYYQPI